jgi:hypothetical protein
MMGWLWRLFRHPLAKHEWTEPFTIPGFDYTDGHVRHVCYSRTLRICEKCGCTDAMAWPWCPRRQR